jgi:hypothetical protein
VNLIFFAVVGAVFLIARRSKNWGYVPRLSGKTGGISGETALASFFALFWGWADYNPKDWSSAPYKRGYGDERRRSTNCIPLDRRCELKAMRRAAATLPKNSVVI